MCRLSLPIASSSSQSNEHPDSSLCTLMSLPRAAMANRHRLAALKQQKFIFPQLWRPEVQNPGVHTGLFCPWRPKGRIHFLPPPAPGGPKMFLGLWLSHSSLCTHDHWAPPLLCPLCVSCKDTSQWIWGPPKDPSFRLQGFCPNKAALTGSRD